jgi:tryptophan synthase alpha chain
MPDRIMSHLVAFYPDAERSLEAARAMIDGGAAYLEVQFPFSEPTADGPVIQRACARALSAGFTVKAGMRLLERICGVSKTPVFVMSYANVVFRHGTIPFARRVRETGARGLIVPDLPPDTDEGLYAAGQAEGLDVVPVVAPTITGARIRLVASLGVSYVYAALRKGITGETTAIGEENLAFLRNLSRTGAKIVAGFGVSTRAQVEALSPHVHAVVVGSAFIGAIPENGPPYDKVREKMEALLAAVS